jgi:hypothetical protein
VQSGRLGEAKAISCVMFVIRCSGEYALSSEQQNERHIPYQLTAHKSSEAISRSPVIRDSLSETCFPDLSPRGLRIARPCRVRAGDLGHPLDDRTRARMSDEPSLS